MASAKNPIINRIKGHKQQVKGMLTPGLRASSAGSQTGNLSALFTHFSVGKAKEASSKMRILDYRKMGKMQAETGKAFFEAIPEKFQNVQSLLHLNPNVSRENNIWQEIDKTLPSQGSTQYEEPLEPGEMRAGSVIQKFSMFPKEGQSIESFKKQAQSLPKPSAKRRSVAQKPKVDPRSRLFSRVQEVSASQPPTEVTERPPEKPAPAKDNTIQRQVDTAPQPPAQKPSTVSDVVEKTPPPSQPPAIKQPAKPVSLSPKADAPKAQATEQKTEPAPQLPLKKVAQVKPARTAEKKEAQPEKDIPALKAEPLTKETQPSPQAKNVPQKVHAGTQEPEAAPQARIAVQKTVPQKKESVRPKAKAISVPKKPIQLTPAIVQRQVDVPAKAAVKASPPTPKRQERPLAPPASSKVQKPSVDASKRDAKKTEERPLAPLPSSKTPKTSVERKPDVPSVEFPQQQQEPVRESKASLAPTEKTPEKTDAPFVPPTQEVKQTQTETPLPEMPLRKKIQARQTAPKAIKALRPEKLISPKSPPLMKAPPRPLVSREKYSRAEKPAEQGQESALQMPRTPEPSAPSALPAEFAAFESMVGARPSMSQAPSSVPSQVSSQSAPLSQAPLPMALAKTPRIVQTVPDTVEKQEQKQAALLEQQKEQLPPASREPSITLPDSSRQLLTSKVSASGNSVVQRQPAEATSDDAQSEKERAPNLDQLAEDVLPFVKRILEIESERIPGNWR